MKVTLADIARRVDLSESTVSRALSAPDRVNKRTRERVLEAAQQLGYTALRAEPAGASRAARTVGLIVPDIVNPFFPPVIKSVQSRAAARGYSVLIADINEHPPDELRRAVQMMEQVDGLIVVSARTPEEKMDQLAGLHPLVLVNRSHGSTPSVSIENDAGIVEAVQHLVALGHREICYLNGPRRSWSNSQRQAAMRAACEAANVPLREFGPFEPEMQAGVLAADLVSAAGVTAVIAFEDLIALGMIARLTERGVHVGPDISVIGVDDSPMAGMAYPPLTSIHVPGAEAGLIAADMLIDLVETPERQSAERMSDVIKLETRLVIRGSTAPAPR